MEHSILAIGAHIGDMELTAGGLLATCALQGCSITTLALTAGEKGAPKGADIAEYRKQKVQEAENFAAKLGGKAKVLDYPDGLLADDDAVRMQVAAVIREVQPELIITQGPCGLPPHRKRCLVLRSHSRIRPARRPALRQTDLCGKLGGCPRLPPLPL